MLQNNADVLVTYSRGEPSVLKIETHSKRVAIIMHSTISYDSAVQLEEELESEGFNVIRLNGGVEEESRTIEELENAISTILKYI